jgi:hypothetical protein
MKRTATIFIKVMIGLVGLGIIAWVVYTMAILPKIDRWGATEAEISTTLPGDEFVAQPLSIYNRAINIQAAPEKIYPWLVQMGADKAALYSYTFIENMINCPQTNADRIHPEWQGLKPGDPVKMCPAEFGPPPFTTAAVVRNQAVVMGHQNTDGTWSDTWQFIIVPQTDGTSRLILRTRTTMVGGLWDAIHPGVFIMEYGMLNGIKTRAEGG